MAPPTGGIGLLFFSGTGVAVGPGWEWVAVAVAVAGGGWLVEIDGGASI